MKKQQPEVYCRFTELRTLVSLVEHPKNPNTHPQAQLERLAEVIRGNGWRQPITVSDRSGYIIKGHGRYQAAKLAGFSEVPVEVQHYDNEAAELADMLADNRIAELSEIDNAALNEALQALQIEDPEAVELSGYTDDDWAAIRSELDGMAEVEEEPEKENPYTVKTDCPQYEITGETPPLSKCLDTSKTDELLVQIEKTEGITEKEKEFLIKAAQRHLAFSYREIAEYYAAASKPMQELMEASALVVIDFEDAVKHGYVEMTKTLQELKAFEGVEEETE